MDSNLNNSIFDCRSLFGGTEVHPELMSFSGIFIWRDRKYDYYLAKIQKKLRKERLNKRKKQIALCLKSVTIR